MADANTNVPVVDAANATGAPAPLPQADAVTEAANSTQAPAAGPAKPKPKRGKKAMAEQATDAAAAANGGKPADAPKPEKQFFAKMQPETLQVLNVGALSFDPSVQMRTKKFDENTVETYRGFYEENGLDFLPPLRAIELPEHEIGKDGCKFLVWDGHQRGEAIKRISPEKMAADKKFVKVMLSRGNRNLARRLAAGANAQHGLPRTQEDLKKTIRIAVEDAELLDEIGKAFKGLGREKEDGTGGGGMQRALAATIGCSKDRIWHYLRDMGLKTAGDKVIKLTEKEAADWKAQKNGGTPPAPTVSTSAANGMTPEQADRQAKLDAMAKQTDPVLLKTIEKDAVNLQMCLERLCERPALLATIKDVFAQMGQPLHFTEEVSTDGSGQTTQKATWPVMDFVVNALGAVTTKFMFEHSQSANGTPAAADGAKSEPEVTA